MSYTANELNDGLKGAIESTINAYPDSASINNAYFSNLDDLGIDEDTIESFENYLSKETQFWDDRIAENEEDYVANSIKDIFQGLGLSAMQAQKSLALTISTEVRTLVTEFVTVEQAFVTYMGSGAIKVYVEKATGAWIYSETVVSETTHIPIGKYISSLAKALEKAAIVAGFKNALIATYEAANDPGDITAGLNALSKNSLAGGATLAGLLVERFIPGAFGIAAGAVVTNAILASEEEITDRLANSMLDSYNLMQSTSQMLEGANEAIVDSITAFWSATGEVAEDFLDNIEEKSVSFYDSLAELTADTVDTIILSGSEILNALQTLFDRAETERPDPLVLDLNGNNTIDLNASHTVYFDVDLDGFAEAVNWVGAGDGLLAIDVNDNGKIDNAGELFGNATEDGFSVLSSFDLNDDGVMDAGDAVWSDLIVWKDANQDGYSQQDELLTLSSLGITSINLGSVVATSANSAITHEGTITTTAGTMKIANVLFDADFVNTRYVGDYTLDISTLFLPTLRGYGAVKDLHIAASMDQSLDTNGDTIKDKLSEIVSLSFNDLAALAADKETFSNKIHTLLYHWAGVEGASIVAHYHVPDPRPWLFLEKYLNRPFIAEGMDHISLGFMQGDLLKEAMDQVVAKAAADILLQSSARSLFEGASYDLAADGLSGGPLTLSQDMLDDLSTRAAGLADTSARAAFWDGIANLIHIVAFTSRNASGLNEFGLGAAEEQKLDDAIQASDAHLVWFKQGHDSVNGVFSVEHVYSSPGGLSLTDTAGDDIISGSALDDSIYAGNAGSDTLNGLGGNDRLFGGWGNDIIHGGSGNDHIYGEDQGTNTQTGDDILNGDAGNDLIVGGFGNDQLNGGDGDDRLYGDFIGGYETNSGLNLVDTLDGGLGNDLLVGGIGDDILIDGYGSTGQNLLEGGLGTNTYRVVGGGAEVWINTGHGGILEVPAAYADEDDLTITIEDDLVHIVGSVPGSEINVFVTQQLTSSTIDTIKFASNYEADLNYLLDVMRGLPTQFSDTLYSRDTSPNNTYSDMINALGGDDVVYGDGGNDFLYGGEGNDILRGEEGDDSLEGNNGSDTLYGGNGSDQLLGNSGDDILNGDDGSDTIHGGSGIDIAHGGNGDDTISGDDGADFLHGDGGGDTLFGGDGDDFLEGGEGNDLLRGDNGSDTYVFSGLWGNDRIQENNNYYTGTDRIRIGSGLTAADIRVTTDHNGNFYIHNLLNASVAQIDGFRSTNTGIDNSKIELIEFDNQSTINLISGLVLTGGSNADELHDTGQDGTLIGNDGDDTLWGYNGNDTLRGGNGADSIYGGEGNDILSGGAGQDTLWGDNGADTFVFNKANAYLGTDNIFGFNIAQGDKIDLSDMLTNFYSNSLVTDFVQITSDGSNSYLKIDADGGANNFVDVAVIRGVPGLTDEQALVSSGNLIMPVGTPPPSPTAPTANQVFLLNPPTANTIGDSAAINTASYYAAKTISVSFETGSNVTTRQVIYEQGGGLRGLNIFVESGKLYQAVWNYNAGTSWGYKETEVAIAAGTSYTATLVFNATGSATGTLTSYLNGVQTGQQSGSGYLYGHAEDVGIGMMKDQSRYHTNNEYGDGYTFTGQIEKISHYNAALSGTDLTQLHQYMRYHWLDLPVAKDDIFSGAANAVITGNVLANNGNGADIDPDNDPLSITSGTLTTAHGGTVSLSSNGNFIYTPASNYNGYDNFNYTVKDGTGGSDTGTVKLTIGTPPPMAPTANQVFLFEPPAGNTLPDSAAINTASYYTAKTISVSFETGANVTTRQVIYEQGGGLRGLNIFVESGKLYQAVWNYNAGTSWGYKETEVAIAAGAAYTTTLVFNATGSATGTLTSYLNGVQTGQQSGAGYLYGHSEDVGIGWMKDQSRYHTNNEYGDGYTFTGQIEKIAHYNAALAGADLTNLHQYMGYHWLDQPVAKDDIFSGNVNDSIIGNVLVNNGNGADTDPDNNVLSVTSGSITTTHGGIVTLSSNGNFTYAPASNYQGYDSFDYTVNDGTGNSDIGTVNLTIGSPALVAPTANQVFLLNPPTANTIGDSAAINTASYYATKTISVSFETGSNVTTRQVIYEQGGGLRGLNIFVESGKLYQAVWNYNAGTSWGYKETEVAIAAGTSYTATLVFNATGSATGTLTSYLNGVQTGQQSGTGYLYGHAEDVGIGMMKDQSRYHTNNEYGDGYTFTGQIEKISHYNAALSGTDLTQLHQYMAGVTQGTSGADVLYGYDTNDQLFGAGGNDILHGNGGRDLLYGGTGEDIFVFNGRTAFSDVDIIKDFSVSDDAIDLSDVLQTYDPLTALIENYVQITTSGSDSILKVDIDGGGDNFVQIATISNVSGLTDEVMLVSSGVLIVS